MTCMHGDVSSHLLDLLLDDPAVGRCLVAPTGNVVRTNDTWLRSTGLDREQALRADVVELFPGGRSVALAMHARVRAGHRVVVPRHARRVGERQTWWEGSIVPVPMEGGTGMLLTTREVTSEVPEVGSPRVTARAIAEHILDQVFVLEVVPGERAGPGVHWRYVDANEAAARLVGMPRARLIGKTIGEVLGPRAVAVAERLRRVLESGRAERYETSYHEREFVVTLFRIDGRTVGSAALEVTDRRRAEEAQARLAAIVDGADAAILSKDLRGKVLTWNAAAERLLGHRADEAIGRSIDVIIPPERRDEERQILARIAAGEFIPAFETQRLTKGGAVLEVSVTVSPIRARDGRIVGASTILRDVTARKGAEKASARDQEALRESRAKLDAALASMTDAVFISDAEGRFIEFNHAFATFHRFASRAECARTFTEYPDILDVSMADGTPAPMEQWPVRRALRGEVATNAQYLLRRRDTGEAWAASYSSPPSAGRGRSSGPSWSGVTSPTASGPRRHCAAPSSASGRRSRTFRRA